MKKIITAIIILTVLTVSIVLLKCFTDILGAPLYIYDTTGSYRTGKDFYKTDEVYELELRGPSKNTLNHLKYCSNLKKLTIFAKLDNLDFISDLEITDLFVFVECNDWSKIGTLTHLKRLDVFRSDFNDVSLLREMSELETLHIHSQEIVDISHIGELPKLNDLDICVQNDDISDISNCTNLTSLGIIGCPNITDISFLKDMDNVKELLLQGLNIEDQSFLTEMNGLESVDIRYMQIEDEIIRELQDKGVTVINEYK
ncbi:MAG: hypothetical protein K2N72_08110 [Oscillospiraceae bacterium]|nr:hypothetical protein [Oscillospiraceae bacterium]